MTYTDQYEQILRERFEQGADPAEFIEELLGALHAVDMRLVELERDHSRARILARFVAQRWGLPEIQIHPEPSAEGPHGEFLPPWMPR